MMLANKPGITDQIELAKTEEKISKQKAKQLFDSGDIHHVEVGTFAGLAAMQRSPVKDLEIKVLLQQALTDRIDDRALFMKGIDVSYDYERYSEFKTEEL